jgi:hypothetical protein
MNKQQFSQWLNKLGKAWKERNPQAIPALFAENFKYYETPFEKPYTDKAGLIKLWQDVPKSQKDISFNFEIIMVKNNNCIARWQATFTRIKENKKAYLDGIFFISLNKEGLCTLLRQWWMAKENP